MLLKVMPSNIFFTLKLAVLSNKSAFPGCYEHPGWSNSGPYKKKNTIAFKLREEQNKNVGPLTTKWVLGPTATGASRYSLSASRFTLHLAKKSI